MNKGEGTKLRTGCKRCTLHSQRIRCSHRAYTWLESLAAELREWKCESFECCMRSMGSLQQLVGIIGKQFRGIITSSIDATLHILAYLSPNAFTQLPIVSGPIPIPTNTNCYCWEILEKTTEDMEKQKIIIIRWKSQEVTSYIHYWVLEKCCCTRWSWWRGCCRREQPLGSPTHWTNKEPSRSRGV